MSHGSVANDPGVLSGQEPERGSPVLILASEALRDDVAPLEPGEATGRWVIGGVALSLSLLGVALRLGLERGQAAVTAAAAVSFAASGAAAALALLPFSYLVRAAAISALGAALVVLGIGNQGPLGNPGGAASPVELARLLALCVLPGALLFRGRYRAYARARLVLGAALLVALPFAIGRGAVVLDGSVPWAARASALVALLTVCSGLFGFMGEDTTAGGAVWAALVLGALPADVALPGIARGPQPESLAGVGIAVATACAATLVTTGVYHLLAAWLSRDARRQVRQPGKAPKNALG